MCGEKNGGDRAELQFDSGAQSTTTLKVSKHALPYSAQTAQRMRASAREAVLSKEPNCVINRPALPSGTAAAQHTTRQESATVT